MPALPWIRTATADPGIELTVVATMLPLRSHRHIPAFLRWTMRIRSQLADAEGLVGYSLDAHLFGKTFWTVSAWTSQTAMERFVREEAHAGGMAAIRPNMQRPAFLVWTLTAENVPIRWGDVRSRMAAKVRNGQDRK